MAEVVVEGLRFGYTKSPVLRNISLHAGHGRCVVLFGANGSGKSTLLSVLATLQRPQSGHYRLDGLTIDQDREAMRHRLLYLGHHTHLYGHLTARENLLFFSELRGKKFSVEDCHRVLEACGLLRFADRPVSFFSAGMRKRLALGRVLLISSALWLLDEPYSSLDREGVDWLNRLLQHYLSVGGTAIIATHDPERVSGLSSRTFFLQNGVLLPTNQEDLSC